MIRKGNSFLSTSYARLAIDYEHSKPIYLYFVFPDKNKESKFEDYNYLFIYFPKLSKEFYFDFSDYKCTDILGLYYFLRKHEENKDITNDEYNDLDCHFAIGKEEDEFYVELDLGSSNGSGENYIHFSSISIEDIINFKDELLKCIIEFTEYNEHQIEDMYLYHNSYKFNN